MRFLPLEPNIKIYEEGFENDDILDRRKIGQALSNFCENVETPSVIALNGAYGTGKSYFLQKWVGAHNLENGGNALTVYISAFNHDYLEDPFSAIILALEERLQKEAEKFKERQDGFSKTKKLFAKLAVPAAKISFRTAAAWASACVSEIAGAAIKAAGESAEQAADTYLRQQMEKQHAREQFRTALTEAAKDRKLIIVIDELDRARPDYALSMLETIKHFFTIDNVHFILGVNMTVLESMVKCRYGFKTEKARAYLQRFLTQPPLALPDIVQQGGEPRKTILAYIEHEATKMGLPSNTVIALCRHLAQVSKNYPISLRDAGKILSQVALVFSFQSENFSSSVKIEAREIIFTLITTSILDKELYNAFLAATITQEKILHYYGLSAEDYYNFAQRVERLVKEYNWFSAGEPDEDYDMKYIVYMWITLTKGEELSYSEGSFIRNRIFIGSRRKLSSPESRAIYIQKIQKDYVDILSLFLKNEQ